MNHHSPEMFTNTYLRVSVSKEITYDSVISSVSSYNSRGFQVTLEPHKDQGESYSSEFGAVHKVRHALRGEGGLPKGDISL